MPPGLRTVRLSPVNVRLPALNAMTCVEEMNLVFFSTAPLISTLAPSTKPDPLMISSLPTPLHALEIAGPAAAITLTPKEQVPLGPEPSVAVHVTVVVPTGKVVPDGGAQVTVTPAQPAGGVAAGYVTIAPEAEVAVTGAGGAGQIGAQAAAVPI